MANLAIRLKELREEKRLKKIDVARSTGISRSAITSYEMGTRDNPTQDKLKTISKFFGVSIDYLTGRSDIRDPLSSEELVKIFRELNDENRLQLIKYASYLLNEQNGSAK